jgi:hypothetical protein
MFILNPLRRGVKVERRDTASATLKVSQDEVIHSA